PGGAGVEAMDAAGGSAEALWLAGESELAGASSMERSGGWTTNIWTEVPPAPWKVISSTAPRTSSARIGSVNSVSRRNPDPSTLQQITSGGCRSDSSVEKILPPVGRGSVNHP